MKTTKRDLLKGLAVGSAWTAPVVSSVMLPAHAVATTPFPCSAGTCGVEIDAPVGFGLFLVDGVVSVIGTHIGCYGDSAFAGSAPINPDGSFEMITEAAGVPDEDCVFAIFGTISIDCSSVSGTVISVDGTPFSSELSPTELDPVSCN